MSNVSRFKFAIFFLVLNFVGFERFGFRGLDLDAVQVTTNNFRSSAISLEELLLLYLPHDVFLLERWLGAG
jgi:hypothetical protein